MSETKKKEGLSILENPGFFYPIPKIHTLTPLKSHKTEGFESPFSAYQEESPTCKVEY